MQVMNYDVLSKGYYWKLSNITYEYEQEGDDVILQNAPYEQIGNEVIIK